MKPPVNCHIEFEPLKMANCRKKCVIPKELIQNVCKTLWIKAKSQHFNHIFWLCLIYNTLWWCTKTTVQKLHKGQCAIKNTLCDVRKVWKDGYRPSLMSGTHFLQISKTGSNETKGKGQCEECVYQPLQKTKEISNPGVCQIKCGL